MYLSIADPTKGLLYYYNYPGSISQRQEKGRANVEQQGLICAEEGLMCNPFHSRGYLLYIDQEDWQWSYRKVKVNGTMIDE